MTTTYEIRSAYDARETLREVGGQWDAAGKCWRLTAEQMAEVERRRTPTYSRTLCRAMASAKIVAVEAP